MERKETEGNQSITASPEEETIVGQLDADQHGSGEITPSENFNKRRDTNSSGYSYDRPVDNDDRDLCEYVNPEIKLKDVERRTESTVSVLDSQCENEEGHKPVEHLGRHTSRTSDISLASEEVQPLLTQMLEMASRKRNYNAEKIEVGAQIGEHFP